MHRPAHSFFSAISFTTLSFSALLTLAACSTPPAAVERHFDLGGPVAAPAAATPRSTVLVVPDLSAPADLDGEQILYRQPYLNAFERHSYNASHWTAPPAQLLGRMLRAALVAQGPVLTAPTPAVGTVLQFELIRFEQVFDQAASGHGLLQLRATLTSKGVVVAQRDFKAQAPCPSPDAAGAAEALAQASRSATADVLTWLAAQQP